VERPKITHACLRAEHSRLRRNFGGQVGRQERFLRVAVIFRIRLLSRFLRPPVFWQIGGGVAYDRSNNISLQDS
jgi:hypothetical protein